MQLSKLLHDLPHAGSGSTEAVEVTGLQYNSRLVQPGNAFFALPGLVHDGHDYLKDAIAHQASTVFVEKNCEVPAEVVAIQVDNCRLAMAQVARVYFNDPTRDIPVVGITGTNGKTTISYLLEGILSQAGMAPAVFGTVNYRFQDLQVPAPHTTPEAIDLLSQMAAFRRAGAGGLIIEVSSHALEQHRADGIHYQVGVFTNLTPEHLDYHRDMNGYFTSKRRLFDELLPRDQGRAVINVDDVYGAELAATLPGSLTCGKAGNADIHPVELEIALDGIRAQITTPKGRVDVVSRLVGAYNVENILCAVGAGIALDLSIADIGKGLATAPVVPGRLERIENDREALILVDYAHTGDALQRVLEAMIELQPKRLITVFGCGGDRDRTKRPVMGEAATLLSDIAIVTSDNPRTEDPQQIIEDVRVGMRRVHSIEWSPAEAKSATGRGFVVIPDRRAAIRFAVSLLQAGDVLLVAGKGHEDYQVLGHERIHFDDREELRSALEMEVTA